MPVLLTCPQGHQYESPPGSSACCPVCGLSSQRATLIDPAPDPQVTCEHVPGMGLTTAPAPPKPHGREETIERVLPSPAAPRIPPPPLGEEGSGLKPGSVPPQHTRLEPTATVDKCREATAPVGLGTIAGYELLEVLGRGGMGIVYKARQKGLNRLVALKMILAGAHAGPQHLARFRTEAQAVATLQHPNIVQIHEVGEHEGQPFLSLEFVDGEPLDKKLASKPQAPRDAARLVETLARAMQAAHDQGIVHRDLKPANILIQKPSGGSHTSAIRKKPDSKTVHLVRKSITPSDLRAPSMGVPKITDFGLAKRMEEDSNTVTGAIMGTPSYMAPEQATGKTHEIGPLADVYSLGAILYETLTGRPPFIGVTPLDTLRQVQTQEPIAPTRLQPKLPRDLETICLKCLEKEPPRRYASAGELADDLERFCGGEPILARPVSIWVRGLKWARRYPVVASLLAVSALFLVTLAVVIGWSYVALSVSYARAESEKVRAVRNAQKARQAVDDLLRAVAEDLEDEPLMEKKRRELLEKALAFYQDFLQEESSDPMIRLELARTYKQVGDIYRFLGQHPQSQEHYSRMITMAGELPEAMRNEWSFLRDVTAGYSGRSLSFKATDKLTEAVDDARQALRLQQAIPLDAAAPNSGQQELARCHYFLGVALAASPGGLEEAEREYQNALRIQQALVDTTWPAPSSLRRELARTLNNLGLLQYRTRRGAGASVSFQQARDLQQQLAEEFPEKPAYRRELARTYLNIAVMLQADPRRLQEAETSYEQVRTLFEGLVRDFPSVPDYRNDLAMCCANQGILQRSVRRFDAAQQSYLKALELQRKLVEEFPLSADYRQRLGRTLVGIGHVHRDRRQDLRAEEAYREAIAVFERLLQDAQTADYHNALALARYALARVVRQRPACVPVPDIRLALATTLCLGMIQQEQLANLRQAVRQQTKALELNAQNHSYQIQLCDYRVELAKALVEAGDHAQAAKSAAALAEVLPDDQTQLYRAAFWLARCVSLVEEETVRQGYANQSIALLRRAIAKGYKNTDALNKTPFDALRQYPEFRRLLEELQEKTGKAIASSTPPLRSGLVCDLSGPYTGAAPLRDRYRLPFCLVQGDSGHVLAT